MNYISRGRSKGRRIVITISAASLVCSLFFESQCYAFPPNSELVRSNAYAYVTKFENIQFSFKFTSSSGMTSNVRFLVEGNQFRVDRRDELGALIGSKQAPVLETDSAYNQEQFQTLDVNDSILRLENGNIGANYNVQTPYTLVYAWLRRPGYRFRWDSILDSEAWREVFSEVKYIGKRKLDAWDVEVVEFPHSASAGERCIFRVCFAPELGYLPVNYERRVEETGEVSSVMSVDKAKVFEIDGRPVGVPTQIEFVESGADGVSLKQTITLVVDESSIKINEDIDESMFTIRPQESVTIYDVDEQKRLIASITKDSRREVKPLVSEPDTRSVGLIPLLVGNAIVLAAIIVFFLIRRSSSH